MHSKTITSNITIQIDNQDRLVSFEFSKVPCGIKASPDIHYDRYCAGKTLEEIINIPFEQAASVINPESEEDEFSLYVEWEALRTSIAQYLGIDREDIDRDRCLMSSLEHTDDSHTISLILLPPKELPKI
jgi:hypothetical protein